jgi:hypothetical protein
LGRGIGVCLLQFESASVLAFAEEVFGLAPMAPADTCATPLDDMFDFSQSRSRRRFTRIKLTQPLAKVLEDSRTSTVPSDGGETEAGD